MRQFHTLAIVEASQASGIEAAVRRVSVVEAAVGLVVSDGVFREAVEMSEFELRAIRGQMLDIRLVHAFQNSLN